MFKDFFFHKSFNKSILFFFWKIMKEISLISLYEKSCNRIFRHLTEIIIEFTKNNNHFSLSHIIYCFINEYFLSFFLCNEIYHLKFNITDIKRESNKYYNKKLHIYIHVCNLYVHINIYLCTCVYVCVYTC